MLNATKIKKLFRKGVKISGISFPPTDDKPATDILFTIDGVIAFRISSYDTELVAKLIEVEAMDLDYSFKHTFDLTKLLDVEHTEPFTLTPVTLVDNKKPVSLLQGSNKVAFVYKEQVECFKDGSYVGFDKELSPIYWIENDIVKGLIMPIRGTNADVIQDIATRLTPTVSIKSRDGDEAFGYCSNCHRAERFRTWDSYKYCPVCGYKVSKGGGTK